MIKSEGIINTKRWALWNLMHGLVAQNKNRMKLKSTKSTRNAFLGCNKKTCYALGFGELPKNKKYVSMPTGHKITPSHTKTTRLYK